MLVRQSRQKRVGTISLRLIAVLFLAPLLLGGCGVVPGEPTATPEPAPSEPVLSNDLIRGCTPVPGGLPPPPGMPPRPGGQPPPGMPPRPDAPSLSEAMETIGLKEGGKAVNFTLKDITGNEYVLSRLLAEKPVVMLFGSFT